MSPCTNVMLSATSSRFGRFPAYVRRSSTTAWSPGWCSTQNRVKFDPMKPAPPVTRMFTVALCSQAHVRAPLRLDLLAERVRLVALRQDRVGDAPVGADLGIVPRDAELVGGVVVAVDEVRDRHVGQGREPVCHSGRDEHAAVVVGAVGGLPEVEGQGGAVGRGALAKVV